MPNTSEKNEPNKGCKTFTVKRNENISAVAATKNLPVGPCNIKLYYGNGQDKRRYINGKTRNVKIEGRTVMKYFDSTDKENGREIARKYIISNEMNKPGHIIEEITVTVCPKIIVRPGK